MSSPPPPAVDRSRPPAPGPLRPTRFPPFHRFTLGNGLTLITVHQPGLPLVLLELVSRAGAHWDPPGKQGRASLAADLLDEGTRERSAPEISALVEGLGGSLATGVSWDAASVGLLLQSRHLEEGLQLLAEISTGATFPAEELERVRRRRLGSFLRRRDEPAAQADLRLMREVYGDGYLYASSLYGDEESLKALGRSDVADFYRQHWSPAACALIAVGGEPPETLRARVEATLGRTAPGQAVAAPSFPEPPRRGRQVVIVDRPGSSQTELRLGAVGVPRHHPDYSTLRLMNTLLGGKFTSRLNLNLRERHGFTYGARSYLSRRLGPGPLTVATAVANDAAGAAVREILQELAQLRAEAPPEQEVADAAQYLVGTFPFTLQSIGGIAQQLQYLVVFDLPDDYFDHYPARFAEIRREEVLAAARAHLDPDGMAIVAVGPAEELAGQLEPFGPVTVREPL